MVVESIVAKEKINNAAYRDVIDNNPIRYPGNSLYQNTYNYYKSSLGNPTDSITKTEEFTIGILADLHI